MVIAAGGCNWNGLTEPHGTAGQMVGQIQKWAKMAVLREKMKLPSQDNKGYFMGLGFFFFLRARWD